MKIFVNQSGYFKNGPKKAVIAFPCEKFQVRDERNHVVYEGETKHFGLDIASMDNVYQADFSDFQETGRFFLSSEGHRCEIFEISDKPYDQLLYDTMRAFYYLRCGCALEEKYAGEFVHSACHTGMAVEWFDHSVSKEVTGGWHDAGDYGRYITAGACALAHLLFTYKMYGESLKNLFLNIPESGRKTPDFLSECRYELQWMLKLQKEDGGVYHKVTTARHASFIMPQEDLGQLYLLPVSSMATADFVGVCALGEEIYREYDAVFADQLREAATKSYGWLLEHPEFVGFKNPEGCGTGEYGEWNDLSNRFWAAAAMYAMTGLECYEKDMRTAGEAEFPKAELGYGEVGGFGLLAYLLCEQKKDENLVAQYKEIFQKAAESAANLADSCGYAVSMNEKMFYWGSNMRVMKMGMLFGIADYLRVDWKKKKALSEYAQDQLNYLMGVNALGISYVSGNGSHCINQPHLRPAHADGIEKCIPGMVSGGANKGLQDGRAKELVKPETPPMKCFADHVDCYSLNEITIYWNSPTVATLAYLLQHASLL